MVMSRYMKRARYLAVTLALGLGLSGSLTWAAPVTVVGGTAQLPNTVTMTKASEAVVPTTIVTLVKEEADTTVKKQAPATRQESLKKQKLTPAMRAKLEAKGQVQYENALKVQEFLKQYVLGQTVDVYQWKLNGSEGVQTAWLYTAQPSDELVRTYNAFLNESVIDLLLPSANEQWLAAEGRLNTIIQEKKAATSSSSAWNPSVRLLDQTPIEKLTGTAYPTYTTKARVLLTVNGFWVPEYVSAAVVLTAPKPTVYLMLADDTDRQQYEPIFREFISTLR